MLTYIEGDAAEIASISQAFCDGKNRNHDLYVGSVKSNIGHLEAASCMAGLIKAILVVEKGLIPPNLDFVNPKPGLNLKERRIKVLQSKKH
jgi:acyl transferase domain-containing protein